MSPKLLPLVPLLYFVALGCHPRHPVDILRPPAAPHPLLNACVDNPEECLPAFERAALKGLKKVAGQALVLHALQAQPEAVGTGDFWLAALALNPTPWVPAEDSHASQELMGTKTPVPEYPRFGALGFDTDRPEHLSESLLFGELPFSFDPDSTHLHAKIAAAFGARMALWEVDGALFTEPVVPTLTLIAGMSPPGGPGPRWAESLLQADDWAKGDTPLRAFSALEEAYKSLEGRSNTAPAREYVLRVSSRLAAHSLARIPESLVNGGGSSDPSSLWGGKLPFFSLPDSPPLDGNIGSSLRDALGPKWLSRLDTTWAKPEAYRRFFQDEALMDTAPLGVCTELLSLYERNIPLHVEVDWSRATGLLLGIADICQEHERVGTLMGSLLAQARDEDHFDRAFPRRIRDLVLAATGNATERGRMAGLTRGGFFHALALSLQKGLPQTRVQRIILPALRAIEKLAELTYGLPPKGQGRLEEHIQTLRDVALNTIPPGAPLWWKLSPALYGAITTWHLAVMDPDELVWNDALSDYKAESGHWKTRCAGEDTKTDINRSIAHIVDEVRLVIEALRRPRRLASIYLDIRERAASLGLVAKEKPPLQPLSFVGWALSAWVGQLAGESSLGQDSLLAAMNALRASGDSTLLPKEHWPAAYFWMAQQSGASSFGDAFARGLVWAARRPDEGFNPLYRVSPPVGAGGEEGLQKPEIRSESIPDFDRGGMQLLASLFVREIARNAESPLPESDDFAEQLSAYFLTESGNESTPSFSSKWMGAGWRTAHIQATDMRYQDAYNSVSTPVPAAALRSVWLDCTLRMGPSSPLSLRIQQDALTLLAEGIGGSLQLQWHTNTNLSGCRVLRPKRGHLANRVAYASHRFLYAVAAQKPVEQSLRLLDLVALLRNAMNEGASRATLAREVDPGLLGWVGTLARLRGHLLLGTEVDNYAVASSILSGKPLLESLGPWHTLPPSIPNNVDFQRIAPLIRSWVDIESSEGIGTLRAGSEAISYRSDLVPTWSAYLASEVLRAALGDVRTATKNIRRLPPSKDPSATPLESLWLGVFGGIETPVKKLGDPLRYFLKQGGNDDGILAGIRSLGAYVTDVDRKDALALLNSLEEGAELHPILQAEILHSKALLLSRSSLDSDRSVALDYCDKALKSALAPLEFGALLDARLECLRLALLSENYSEAARWLPTLSTHVQQVEGKHESFLVRLEILSEALRRASGENRWNQEALLDALKPFREELGPDWLFVSSPFSNATLRSYLEQIYPR